jgi:hypothetical protein
LAEHHRQRKIKPSEREALRRKFVADNPSVLTTKEYIPHVTEVEDLADVLPEMVSEYQELQEAIAEAEERKRELNDLIKALFEAAEIRAVRGDGWVASRSKDSVRRTLKPEKLLEHGVSMAVIEDSYEEKLQAGSLSVRRER